MAQNKKAKERVRRKNTEITNSVVRKKEAMLSALEKSLGVITTACKATGIARRTFYNWLDEDEEFAELVKEIDDVAIEFAESKLFKLIDDKNPTAIIFFLKTRGKKKGYIERVEVDGRMIETTIIELPSNGRNLEVDKDGDAK